MKVLCWSLTVVTAILIATGCKEADPPRTETWDGPPDTTIVSVHGVVDCKVTSMLAGLRVTGLPVELRETKDGVTKSFVGVNPFQLAGSGARPTKHSQGPLTLWRWDVPGEDPAYAYVVVSSDGTDPVIYGEC
jgi:hypothetical protein